MKSQTQYMVLGKVPPQAVDLEQAILGGLMLESEYTPTVLEILSPDSFYKEAHKVIFSAIIDLFSKSEPIDLLTVTNQLRKSSNLEIAGGAFYITELTSIVGSAANIQYHSRIVQEQFIKREMIRIGSEMQKDGFEDSSDALEIVSKTESSLLKIVSGIDSGTIFSGISLLKESITRIQEAGKKKDGITGIPSGIYELDKITGGWQNSELIIIAARPAMGKTDLALNLLTNASFHGFKGAVFSLEMSKDQLMDRFLAITCEIDREKIKRGKLDSADWMTISNKGNDILSRVFIADEPSLNTLNFRAKARRLKSKEKIDFLVVDYLQLMSSMVNGSTNDKISDISRTLKLTAKELNIPVIALSQLSRSVETRGGAKRPMLSDLRDSGAIEQDADIVIFPYRPIYYGIKESEDGLDTTQLMEIDIAKNRSGSVDTINARYLGKFGKVVNWNQEELKPTDQGIYRTDKFSSNGISDFEFLDEQEQEPLPF